MKKLLLLIFVFMTSIPVMGSGCGCFDGFYLGVAGGVATQMAKGHINAQSDFPAVGGAETLTDSYHFDVCKNRGWGEIFGGWGCQWNCFYLGGRLGGNFSRFDLKVNSSIANLDPADEGSTVLDDSLRVKANSAEFTFDLKPGWVFCQRSMLFGIIGGAVNQIRLKGTSRFNKEAGQAPAVFDLIQVQRKKTTTGFRAGFGLEHMLTQCLSLQVSYVYTWYSKLKITRSQSYTLPDFVDPFVHTANFEAKPRKQVMSIGLAYYF